MKERFDAAESVILNLAQHLETSESLEISQDLSGYFKYSFARFLMIS